MGISKSANKRDYNDKGTYDNLREGDRNIIVYVYIDHRRCTRQD